MSGKRVSVCVFDAYGTLFDVNSAAARHREAVGPKHEAIARLWRQKQLEYSWIRTLMGRHADFWQLTGEALDFALETHGLRDPRLRETLMQAYAVLSAYPEVKPMLAQLRARGLRTAILTNGSPGMIAAAMRSAGIADLIDEVITVEEVGVFKTHPRVYAHALERLGVGADEVSFQSSNAWDAAAACDHGWQVVWVNRSGQPREYQWVLRGHELPDLAGLPDLVAPR